MKLVKEYINDDNFYVELLNESLNEELNIDTIKQIVNKISNKVDATSRLINKFNESRNMHTRKYIASILVVLFLANFASKNNRWSHSVSASEIENISQHLVRVPTISIEKIKTAINKPLLPKETKDKENNLIPSKFISVSNAHISDSTENFIKHHEKLNLTAYQIGDGMITIGYGHAAPHKDSKYKIGDKITEKVADQLFLEDIKVAEDGVKRIIKSWKNPKIENAITQGMFDAMVSMAFNMGINGLRKTEFIDLLEKGKFKTAAQKIKTTKIKSKIKKDGKIVYVEMPGLKIRRAEEYNLFARK